MNVREVLRLIKDDGWYLVTIEGSRRQFKHPAKPGRVTVSGHPSDDVHPKTLKSMLTQAGLTK
ncbi:MAG: type II toxin-antitoxin system HicA family toxin [Pyrinomonadaceae bacterium]